MDTPEPDSQTMPSTAVPLPERKTSSWWVGVPRERWAEAVAAQVKRWAMSGAGARLPTSAADEAWRRERMTSVELGPRGSTTRSGG